MSTIFFILNFLEKSVLVLRCHLLGSFNFPTFLVFNQEASLYIWILKKLVMYFGIVHLILSGLQNYGVIHGFLWRDFT